MSDARRGASVALGAIVVAAGLFLWELSAAWAFTPDDAFITFQYARNLAAGFGPTFNAGQPPIGGYTSFLWMLVVAVPQVAGFDAVRFAKVTGVLCTIAYAVLAAVWSRELVSQERTDAAAPGYSVAFLVLSMASTGSIAVHAVSGMDTALATLLFTAFLYATYRMTRQRSMPTLIVAAILGLATSLTRPDLIPSVAVGLACVALLNRALAARVVAIGALAFALPLALFGAWRLHYYGQLLPLPYYVKVEHQGFAGLPKLQEFVRFAAIRFGPLILVAGFIVRRALIPAVVSAGLLLALLSYPAHVMSYEWRYFFPIVPFGIVLASAGAGLLPHVSSRVGLPARTAGVIATLWCAVAIGALLWRLPHRLQDARDYSRSLADAHEALGRQLGDLPVHGVLAVADAGAMVYYSRWQSIDTFGLNDVVIATTHRHDAAEVLDRHPDVVVLISLEPDRFQPALSWEGDLGRLAMARGFRFVTARRFADAYYLWVLSSDAMPAGRAASLSLGRHPS